MLPRGIPGITLVLCFPDETCPYSYGAFADDAEPPHLTQLTHLTMHMSEHSCTGPFPFRWLSHTALDLMMPITSHGQTTTPAETSWAHFMLPSQNATSHMC